MTLHSNILYPRLKIVTVGNGNTFYTCPIIIYGVDRIMQELSDTGAVVNAQTDKREDAQSGIELILALNNYPLVW